MKIIIYNEYVHQDRGKIKKVYPEGMHNTLKSIYDNDKDISVKTVTLNDIDTGLSYDELKDTDVLLWWGHCAHDKVPDDIVDRVCERAYQGMGIIFLHSAHFSKPFKKLMGTSGSLRWRVANENERIWTVNPHHPIAQGVPQGFLLKREEMYGEHFDIPTPDDVVFTGWFQGGEVFRSGCVFTRGKGKIFYFQPGHETFPIYYNENIRKIIHNATLYVANRNIDITFKANSECEYSRKMNRCCF